MVKAGSTSRKYGLRSGNIICKDLTTNGDMTISGDMTFGDASTDNLYVTGTSTFASAMNVDSTIDIDATTTASGIAVVSVTQSSTGTPLEINQTSTATTAASISIDVAATTTPIMALGTQSFVAVDVTTTASEAIMLKTGTNTRYIRLYSGA